MARNPIIRENLPDVLTPTEEETPHGCYEGWVYMGFEGEDLDGEHVELVERMPCRRCNCESLLPWTNTYRCAVLRLPYY